VPDEDFSAAFDPGMIGVLAGPVDLAEGDDGKQGKGMGA
jgi:hypothetical protein